MFWEGPSGDYWLIAPNQFSGILLCSVHTKLSHRKKGIVDQWCCLLSEVCSDVCECDVHFWLLVSSQGYCEDLGRCSLQSCVVSRSCRNVSVWMEGLILLLPTWVSLGFHSWRAYVPFRAALSLRSKLYYKKVGRGASYCVWLWICSVVAITTKQSNCFDILANSQVRGGAFVMLLLYGNHAMSQR